MESIVPRAPDVPDPHLFASTRRRDVDKVALTDRSLSAWRRARSPLPWARVRPLPFVLLSLLAACGDGEALQARLAAHAEPTSWEDLDPAHPGRRLRDPRTGVVFVRIEPGEFSMGSTRIGESPPRRVRITRPFLIAETELTAGQWRRWLQQFGGDAAAPVPAGDDLPMPASWNDAAAFCRAFGYRLPTEAEWEFAALGGAAADDPAWRDVAAIEAHAQVHSNCYDNAPVRQKQPNGHGLFDTVGNVAEWCSDFMTADYRGRPDPDSDPQGPAAGSNHVLRGGSWCTQPRPQPQTRTLGAPDEYSTFYGFRPARSLGEPPR